MIYKLRFFMRQVCLNWDHVLWDLLAGGTISRHSFSLDAEAPPE